MPKLKSAYDVGLERAGDAVQGLMIEAEYLRKSLASLDQKLIKRNTDRLNYERQHLYLVTSLSTVESQLRRYS